MPFIFKSFYAKDKIKLFLFLMRELNISQSQAQRMIDNKKIYQDGKLIKDKKVIVKGKIDILMFVPESKGLKPIFETKDFAVFDKPSGILVHPRNRNTSYSLLDEVRKNFGDEANITHRIDKETSGLVLVSKNKESEKILKKAFEDKIIKKGYLALAKGKITSDIFIDEPIKKNRDFSTIKLKVLISKDGKPAQTIIKPLKYFPKINATLVEAIPLTGRQHQIRAHLFHVKHPIIGDPIYGIETNDAIKYLDKKMSTLERINITGAPRLMLHANWIEFEFKNSEYKIFSTYNFYEEIDSLFEKGNIDKCNKSN